MISDTQNDVDNPQAKNLSKTIRSKKKPERFGDVIVDALIDDDEEQENSFEAMLGEDSADEYCPSSSLMDTSDELDRLEKEPIEGEVINEDGEVNEKEQTNGASKRRVVHTVSRATKKKRSEEHVIPTNRFWETNFDLDFEQLSTIDNSIISVETTPIEKDRNCGKDTSTDVVSAIVVSKAGECMFGDSLGDEASSENVASHGNCDVMNRSNSAQDSSAANHKLLLEILARVRTIENVLIKNGTLNSVKNEIEKKNSFDEFHAFSKSNRLPLKTIEDMNTFEKNLNHPEFKEIAVRIYSNIVHSSYKVYQIVLLFIVCLTGTDSIKFSWYRIGF